MKGEGLLWLTVLAGPVQGWVDPSLGPLVSRVPGGKDGEHTAEQIVYLKANEEGQKEPRIQSPLHGQTSRILRAPCWALPPTAPS